MEKLGTPRMLILDDEPDDVRALQLQLANEAEVVVSHPRDISKDDLTHADLVLVDLRLENWVERDLCSTISLKPLNGLALAAILQAHLAAINNQRPVAFALHSAHLADISRGLPAETREHILAQANNLEWVFPKAEVNVEVPLAQRILSLANAVHQLPIEWPADDTNRILELLSTLIGLHREDDWMTRAWEEMESCHPPIHEVSQASHGLAFVRWLLFRILPYPCFLWDTHYLAARLFVSQPSLERALEEDGRLAATLQPYRYSGVLSGFRGPRWWRSGIEALLWDLTEGDSFDRTAVQASIRQCAAAELEPIDFAQPIVCLGADLQPLPDVYPIESAVRIQPDDWPPYADQAWTTIKMAIDNPVLRSIVTVRDRERIV